MWGMIQSFTIKHWGGNWMRGTEVGTRFPWSAWTLTAATMKHLVLVAIPVEGEAALGEERGAEGKDGGAGDVGALVEEIVGKERGCPVRAEVVLGGEIELEEAGE